MLELKDICKTFNPNTINAKVALNHLNLTLNDGDFVTVIGGNGAGKSTMLNAIAGVFQVDSGTITIDGQDVTKLPEHKRAAFLGRVFQDPMMGTAPTMQIEENLALAARRGQPRGLKWGITALERADYRELLKTLDLGLEDRLTAKVGLLSGGQRQALTLLMASLKQPKLLLLDEATNGLDPVVRDEVTDMLLDFARDEEHSILISSHIVSDLEKLCDTIAFLHKGRLLLCEEKDALREEYALWHGTVAQLAALDVRVYGKRVTPYGAEALVRRDALPAGAELTPVSIEELFVLMVKGECAE